HRPLRPRHRSSHHAAYTARPARRASIWRPRGAGAIRVKEMDMRAKFSSLLVALLLTPAAWGQPVASIEPSSTHIFPAGGKRGTAVKVRVGGECWPPGMSLQIVGEGVTGPAVLGPEMKTRYEPSLRRVPRDADGGLAGMSYPREFDATLTIADNAEPG